MQYGHSKDHRPDQAQLKLMAAAEEPSGHLLGRVEHDETTIATQRHRMEWQLRVTNLPGAKAGIAQCEEYYRRGWCLEHSFYLLKDKPLGIRPLYVRKRKEKRMGSL